MLNVEQQNQIRNYFRSIRDARAPNGQDIRSYSDRHIELEVSIRSLSRRAKERLDKAVKERADSYTYMSWAKLWYELTGADPLPFETYYHGEANRKNEAWHSIQSIVFGWSAIVPGRILDRDFDEIEEMIRACRTVTN
jgi:hypothetical protein